MMMLSLGACHYGEDAVKEDRKRNQEYKDKRAEEEAKTALPEDAAEQMRNGGKAVEASEADTTAAEAEAESVE